MYTLFNFPPARARGTYLPPEWNNISRGLEQILNTTRDYYSGHTFSVKAQHPLMKILNHYGSMDHLSIHQIYGEVTSTWMDLSMALKMTSSIYEGQVFNGQFFGPGVKEVYLTYSESFDYRLFYSNWYKESSVVTLSHPFTNLMLPIANGLNPTSETGIAVIGIDMVKLILQYRAFREQERKDEIEKESTQRTAMMFIHMYVLPNMLASQLDNSLLNRFNCLMLDEPINDIRNPHPFYIKDWSKEVTKYQEDLVIKVSERNYNLSEIMLSIPLVDKRNALWFGYLPSMYRSRQVNWALTLARLTLLETLLWANHLSNGNDNQSELNEVARQIRRYRSDGTLRGSLPRTLRSEVEDRLDRCYRLANGY